MLANVGIPMIFFQWPLMLAALIPIIIIEAFLIRRWVPLSYREAFTGIAQANLRSTLIGVPLAWGIMFVIELLVMFPAGFAATHWHLNLDAPVFELLAFFASIAWLGPIKTELQCLVPAAAALLLIPSFYMSVWLERGYCLRFWEGQEPAVVRRAVYLVNAASYAALFVMACGWIAFELMHTSN